MFPQPDIHSDPRNLITDVDGVSVRGGAPGTRETDTLDPAGIATAVDAIVLSGGNIQAGAIVAVNAFGSPMIPGTKSLSWLSR